MLNSPIDRVTTMRAPARMPEAQFGSTTPVKRGQKVAPRLAAPSSRPLRSMEESTARTARTMNGSVKSTCPTRMNAQLVRNSRTVP